jgi:hypothetical protein
VTDVFFTTEDTEEHGERPKGRKKSNELDTVTACSEARSDEQLLLTSSVRLSGPLW